MSFEFSCGISNLNFIAVILTDTVSTEELVMSYSEEELSQGLILVYLDVENLLKQDFLALLPLNLTETAKDIFQQSLEESQTMLKMNQQKLTQLITSRVSTKSCAYLKQVSDIPRLYRRTNRDIPTKACTYLTSLLDPIEKFALNNGNNEFSKHWLTLIFTEVSSKFLAQVGDILDSVQKMEESLKRLRRVRDKNSSEKNVQEKSALNISDDDKIRLQLFVDVQTFGQAMEKLGVEKSEDMSKLEMLVDEATKSCYSDYIEKLNQQ